MLSCRSVRLYCQVIHPCELYLTDGRLKAILQSSDEISNFTVPLGTNMVSPLFGWSAGDIVVSIQIIYRIGKAFGEIGGAKEQYAETAAWLDTVKWAFAKVRWAVKELKGHVDSLKTAVSGPLMSINPLLSLQHQQAQYNLLTCGF